MQTVKAKKHLGQHFLTDNNIAKKIADSLENKNNLPIIEIGPGTGMLTQYICEKNNFLNLVEIDTESVTFLEQKYSDNNNIKIHNKDFLKTPLNQLSNLPACIIGNFPYNISSQIFFKTIENLDSVPEVVCMIQKEVADRIASTHGNKTYGILSVLLQTWFDIKLLFDVPPQVFNPPPKVNSSVISLKRNKRSSEDINFSILKTIVKTSFNQRRKTLRNSLKATGFDLSKIDEFTLKKRAEELSVEQFISLSKLYS